MAEGGANGGGRRELFPAAGRDRGSSSGVSPKLRIDNLHYEVSERELSVRQYAHISVADLAGSVLADWASRSRARDQCTPSSGPGRIRGRNSKCRSVAIPTRSVASLTLVSSSTTRDDLPASRSLPTSAMRTPSGRCRSLTARRPRVRSLENAIGSLCNASAKPASLGPARATS